MTHANLQALRSGALKGSTQLDLRHADLQALPAARRDKVLPYIRTWADSAAGLSGAEVFNASQQFHLTRVATVRAAMRRGWV